MVVLSSGVTGVIEDIVHDNKSIDSTIMGPPPAISMVA
jgi:hypothetical protein